MAFVAEEIPQEDKQKLDIEKMKKTAGIYHASEPWRWSIDRDRDVFMMFLGGGGPEIPEFYVMSISNELVVLNASRNSKGNKFTGIELLWKVIILSNPQSYDSKKEELIELIREAFDAYGINGSHRSYVTKFDCDITFLRRQ